MATPDAGCTVAWWGHSAATIHLDGVHFVTDPLLRRHVGPLHWVGHRPSEDEVASTDVVLLSHLHRDHTDLASLARFGPRTLMLVPPAGAATVRPKVTALVNEVPIGETRRVSSVTVRATYAEHEGGRGPASKDAIAIGFLLVGSRSVYVAGDTDLFPGMGDLAESVAGQRIDLALLPVSGWGLNLGPGHLDPSRAADAAALLDARMAIPVHWGRLRVPVLWRTRPGRYRTPATEFAAYVAERAPRCRVVIPAPGDVVDVPLAVAS